jgi:hypothetical protein
MRASDATTVKTPPSHLLRIKKQKKQRRNLSKTLENPSANIMDGNPPTVLSEAQKGTKGKPSQKKRLRP